MSSHIKQYASNISPGYLDKLQELRKEYTPVLASRKQRNTPKEAQAFLQRRKDMQKTNAFRPRPVESRPVVKQVHLDLSKETFRTTESPEPADSLNEKPERFRIMKKIDLMETEPELTVFPQAQKPLKPISPKVSDSIVQSIVPQAKPNLQDEPQVSEESKSIKPRVPVLQIETHNLTISPKASAASNTGTHLFIPFPDIENSAFLFNSSMFRHPSLHPEQFRLFEDFTPEKPGKKRQESVETVSFDDFMNTVIVTPKTKPTPEKTAEFKREEAPVSVRSQTNTPKKENLMRFKEAAEEIERKRRVRIEAVVIIQRYVRRFLASRLRIRLLEKKREIERTKTVAEVLSRIKQSWALVKVTNALRRWGEKRRTEKAKLVNLYRNHCAMLIQKVWRGHLIRKEFIQKTKKFIFAKRVLRGFFLGWRLRKVLHLSPVQDIISQVRELSDMVHNSPSRHFSPTEELMDSAKRTLPSLKGQLLVLIQKLQRNGTWLHYKNDVFFQSPPRSIPVKTRAIESMENEPKLSFEDRPIRPLRAALEEIIDQVEEIRTESPRPKTKFSNFLRRTNRAVSTKSQAVESDHEEEKPRETLPVPTVFEPQEQERPQLEAKPFLKRKSQSIKAKKVKWNVNRKIDCWIDRQRQQVEEAGRNRGEKANFPETEYYPESPIPEPSQTHMMSVEDLETAFEGLLARHTDAHAYFKRAERRDKATFIPQFRQFSYFISHFTEEIFRDTFTALEQHYKLLCREDWLES